MGTVGPSPPDGLSAGSPAQSTHQAHLRPGPGLGSGASQPLAGRQVFPGVRSPSEPLTRQAPPPDVGFLLKQHITIPGDKNSPCLLCVLPSSPLHFETMEFF